MVRKIKRNRTNEEDSPPAVALSSEVQSVPSACDDDSDAMDSKVAATRGDIAAMESRLAAMLSQQSSRFNEIDEKLRAVDLRFQQIEADMVKMRSPDAPSMPVPSDPPPMSAPPQSSNVPVASPPGTFSTTSRPDSFFGPAPVSNRCRVWVCGFRSKQLKEVLERGCQKFLSVYPENLRKDVISPPRNLMQAVALDFPTAEAASAFLAYRRASLF